MFKILRSQAKVFYWVIAATFVLFLFLGGMTSGGMNACQSSGVSGPEAGIVGSVNGDKINSQQYDFAVRQQLAAMRQQNGGQELNANQYAAAEQQAWDALVRSVLLQQAVDKRKIKVTDAEVLQTFQDNPPAELLNQFRDESGQVNMDAYYAALQNPENDWSSAEAYLRTILPQQKLYDEIAASATVADDAVREEYVRQTASAVAEYIGVLFADVAADYEPTEAEISAWYAAHPDDYRSEGQGQAKVVRFKKAASEADRAEALQFANEIRESIRNGSRTFEEAATDYSEDAGSAARGGDLGRFDRKRMVAPFTEVAFSLPVGEISEPVLTNFGYHLIEVLDQDVDQATGEVYEISARHILLKVAPGPDTLDLIRESAVAFAARVKADNFASTAEAEALDLVSPAPFAAGRDIPTVPLSVQGSDFVFAAKPGEVSPVFENSEFFYVVLAEGTLPAGIRPLEEVRGQVTLALRKEHNLKAAKAKLAPFVTQVQSGSSLAAVAAAGGLAHAVTDTFTANGNIEGVGYGTAFNMAVIGGQVGTLVPEIETLRGVFAAKPLWIAPFNQQEYEARQIGLRSVLLQRAQGEVINAWFEQQLADADIVDQRHRLR